MPIRLLPLLAVLFMPLPATASDVPAATGLLHDEVFTGYSPLSRSSELVRRLLSPLNALRVGREHIGKGGIVRDPHLGEHAAADMATWLEGEMGWRTSGLILSPISGGDGNREFLIGAERG